MHLDATTAELVSSELAAFITPRALITVRKDDGFSADRPVARWDANPDLSVHGVAYLLHGLLDDVVDGHFAAVQSLDDEIEQLQEQLFAEDGAGIEVSLVLLRRVVLPMREVVNSLRCRDIHLLDEEMTHYYQDVYDHVLRATEWTESLRDLVTTILVSPTGNSHNNSTAQIHADHAGCGPEYARYEGPHPSRPARIWIRRLTARISGGGH